MEFKYALEVGIKVEFKETKNGEFYAIWNDGKCVEYITAEEFNQYAVKENNESIENDLGLLNGLSSQFKTNAVMRLQHFLRNAKLGKVTNYNLKLGNNGDIVGEVIGTKGSVLLRQYVYLTPTGKQAWRMKVIQG